MKFSFALLFAAALCSVQQASAQITAVVSSWETHKHAECDDTYQIKATHTSAVVKATGNKIFYKVPAPTKLDGVAFVSAPTEITHWKWATDATDTATACTTAAAVTAGTDATMAYASGVFEVANVAVAANEHSCLILYKVCVKNMAIHLVTDNQVKSYVTADATYAVSTATPAYSVVLGTVVPTLTPTAPIVGSKTGSIEVTFTSATTVAVDKFFTLKVPGMKQYIGGQCWFGTDTTKTTALTADSSTTGYINFQAVVASGTDATKVTCDKVGFAAIQDASTGTIVWGDSVTAVTEGGVFSIAAITAAPAAAPFSAAPASAGGSMAALGLGSFAALCLLF